MSTFSLMELIPHNQRFFNRKTQIRIASIANIAYSNTNIPTHHKWVPGYLYEGLESWLIGEPEGVNHLATQSCYCPASPGLWKQGYRHSIVRYCCTTSLIAWQSNTPQYVLTITLGISFAAISQSAKSSRSIPLSPINISSRSQILLSL